MQKVLTMDISSTQKKKTHTLYRNGCVFHSKTVVWKRYKKGARSVPTNDEIRENTTFHWDAEVRGHCTFHLW